MLTAVVSLLALLISSTYANGQSTRISSRPPQKIDLHNGTALQEYTASLRRLLVQSGGGRSMPGMSPNTLAGRIRNPFEGIGLASRQACTNGADNHCFPDPASFCSNCGVCCTQTAGPWCCVSQTAICCPADTGKPDGQQGCCGDWQTCDSTNGCTDPTTTISTTITSWFTSYGTSTSYTTRRSTTTIFTTNIEFITRTVSNVDIGTHVSYMTVTPGAKVRRASVDETISPTNVQCGTPAVDEADARLPSTQTASAAKPPTVTVYAYPQFDLMAHRLEHMGIIVKRQNTITSSITFTVTSTTQVDSVVTSTIASVSSITSTIQSTITSTEFRNAATTVEVTSTITAPRVPDPASSAPATTSNPTSTPTDSSVAGNGGSSTIDGADAASSTDIGPSSGSRGDNGGLSSGASAGIGVGAAIGAAILCALLFFLWRRHRKSKQNQSTIHRSNSPSTGAAVGAGFSEKETSPYATNSPPQRQSYLSNANTLSTHSYHAVAPSEASEMTGATGRPAEMPDNRGFQYAPYELYNETGQDQHGPHEMYTRGQHGTR